MASVWEAHDEVLDRAVAVKLLASHLSEDDRARQRFQREARAAAAVSNHPNVVTIYDVGEHDGRTFMVMELLTGGTVADKLRAGDRISPRTAMRWLRDAASALDAAHAADVVHRDVKPANMLLDDGGRLAIADFGIARLALEDQLTATGTVLGTAAYISPEQAVGDPATAASDRYALAVVAYELLDRAAPVRGRELRRPGPRPRRGRPGAALRAQPRPPARGRRRARPRPREGPRRPLRQRRRARRPPRRRAAPPRPPRPRARTRVVGGGPPRRTAPAAPPPAAARPAAAPAPGVLLAALAAARADRRDRRAAALGRRRRRRRQNTKAESTPEKTADAREDADARGDGDAGADGGAETATPEATRHARALRRHRPRQGAPAPGRGLQRAPGRRLREVARPLPAGARRLRQLERARPVRLRAVREGPRAQPQRQARRGDPGARGAPRPLRRQPGQGRSRRSSRPRRRRRRAELRFDGVAAAIAGVPFMSPEQGRIVYDHVRATRPAEVLELGTAHGVGAAYMAAALRDNGAGPAGHRRLRGRRLRPLARGGARPRRRRRPGRGRARVLLLHVVAQGAGRRRARTRTATASRASTSSTSTARRTGRSTGSRSCWSRSSCGPGGWLLMDDLDWTYAQDPGREATDGVVHRELSEPERTAAAPAGGVRADRRPAPELHRAAGAGRVVGLGAQGARASRAATPSRPAARSARSSPAVLRRALRRARNARRG